MRYLKGRTGDQLERPDFIELVDYTPEEIRYLIDFAIELKAQAKSR